MDTKLTQIVSKAAGTYFIVTDKSQVPTIEAEPKMRLYFINSEKGQTNMLFKFAKGDVSGFTSIFGKGTRLQEKKGNYSISTCIEALTAGPISVINLRAFESVDKIGLVGLNPNIVDSVTGLHEYTQLFNTNGFWTPQVKNMGEIQETSLLSFANVGNNNLTIFVTLATHADVLKITAEGLKSLTNCSLVIDEYPALNLNTILEDTFVNVYVFNTVFDPLTVGTNQYYGQLFNSDGNLDLSRINELIAIPEAGYSTKYTGSLIPHLVSENNVEISIDKVINQDYMNVGLLSYINDALFEANNKLLLDIHGDEFFDEHNASVSDYLLSHVVPQTLTEASVVYPLVAKTDNVPPLPANLIHYGCTKVNTISFEGSFEQGLRIGDFIKGSTDQKVKIENLLILDPVAVIGDSTYNKIKYICSGPIAYQETVIPAVPAVPAVIGTGTQQNPQFPAVPEVPGYSTFKVTKYNLFTKTGLIKPYSLNAYVPRIAQFTNGSAEKQSEILDMMISPGIVKGIKGTTGIRYVVDCFKSFVEPSYKYQFGSLMDSLDKGNRFVRAIINEPFIEDLQKSTNPLFKQTPSGIFDWSYVPDGGNKAYSSKLLTKFALGADMCFFFGPGNVVSSITKPLAGLISNLFYLKTYAYDVVANESGYVDGITELESLIDDDERAFCEAFNYNPIIYFNGGNTIFGNMTGQKAKTAQQQIQNSELLAYIKESLYNLAKGEAFKKGNYDDYLRTETESTNFMTSLALGGAIKADLIVICNSSNNTPEIAKQKIKLVHIEYTPVDALDKVVFDLQIN